MSGFDDLTISACGGRGAHLWCAREKTGASPHGLRPFPRDICETKTMWSGVL